MTDIPIDVEARGHVADLVGQTVSQVRFDFRVTLLTDDGWWVVVETAFRVKGAEHMPEHSDAAVITLTELRRHRISGLEVGTDAALTIGFDNDTVITVPPSPDYDAWSITAPDHRRLICEVGGRLSIYDPAEDLTTGRTRP